MHNCTTVAIEVNLPRTLSEDSQNEIIPSGHSHEVEKASTSRAGIVKLNDTLVSLSKVEALTANQGRELAERIEEVLSASEVGAINKTLDAALAVLATRYTSAYATYQAARDNVARHPENALIYIVNDPQMSFNGLWTVVGGSLVKAPWDVLSSTITSEPFEVLQAIFQGAAGVQIEYEGKTYDTLATLTQVLEEGRTYIQDVLIDLARSNNFTASYLLTESGKFQQEINDSIGAKWYSKSNGYALNDRVMLENGDIVKSTVAVNTNDPNVDMTGWVKDNSASQVFDKSGRTVQDKLDDDLQLKDYAKYKVGDDWTTAIQKADNDAIAQSKRVNIAGGTYDYSGNITIQAHWFGSGLHCTRFRKTAPATITILNGSLRDLSISPDNQIVGDTTHGLVADGVDRKYIENVLTEKHGGDGFVYKRGNLSRFFLRSRSNGGRGVTFANDIVSGNNKACEVWFECTANKKSGFFMENSATTSQNSGQHRGFIIAQNNGSDAIVDDNYDAVLSGNYNDLQLYTEYGGGVWHKASLNGSKVFYSSISHTIFRDEANESNIVSYIPSSNGTRATKNEIFEKLTIYKENSSYSGKLSLSQTASNTFRFEATLSGAQQYLELPANLTLRGAGNAYQFAKTLSGGATLNFSSVPAQGMVERTVTVTGAVTSLQTACVATPAGNIGANLIWSCYVSAFDAEANTTTVTIRVVNPTAAAIASTQLAWRVQVIT